MKFLTLILPGLLATSLIAHSATPTRTSARGVRQSEFNGWSGALLLESRDALPSAVVVPSIGGRVMSYGVHGESVLWVNPETTGRTLAAVGGPFQPGGFQCDVGPEISGLPAHPEFWVGPYEGSPKRSYAVNLRSPEDKTLRVEMEKEIVFDPATGDLGFLHRMKNTSERDAAYCLWHRIACRPGGFVVLPLNKQSRFPAGWSLRREAGGKTLYDGAQPESPSVRVIEGILIAQTGGSATRLGADSNAQWVAYVLGRLLFVVHLPVYSSGVYSEGGNTITVSWDPQMTELQPHSPEARLRSRKTYEFPMKWSLQQLPTEITTPEQARRLADDIPSSPFL